MIIPQAFTTFLNIRDGFTLKHQELTDKLHIYNTKDKKVKCISKNSTLNTSYRYLMRKYLPDIELYDFHFNQFIDTSGKDKIDMEAMDLKYLFDNIETKKKIPTTKGELVVIINDFSRYNQ